jgi:phospholipase C
VLSDLTSFFNFKTPNENFPPLPDMSGWSASDTASKKLPAVKPPTTQSLPTQEHGLALSRALPYALNCTASTDASGVVTLNFINTGTRGAVFHVYDQLNLNRIPRRYTVEGGKTLSDNVWNTFATNFVSAPAGTYNLWVYGPNGFVRTFQGQVMQEGMLEPRHPEIQFAYNIERGGIDIALRSNATKTVAFTIADNAYGSCDPKTISVQPEETAKLFWSVKDSGNWYDLSVKSDDGFHRQFAGRMEDGKDHISDPMMGRPVAPYTPPTLV